MKKHSPRSSLWGDIYRRHVRRGEDHSSAAARADASERRRKKVQRTTKDE